MSQKEREAGLYGVLSLLTTDRVSNLVMGLGTEWPDRLGLGHRGEGGNRDAG